MPDHEPRKDGEAARPARPDHTESTGELLIRVRAGDDRAREALLARSREPLRRFAHGRLPSYARDLFDTDDLVQVTLIKAFQHMGTFEQRGEGAFFAYLRQITLNKIRDEIRRVSRRPGRAEFTESIASQARSPVEEAIGREALERYEAALLELPEAQRGLVMMRLEMGLSYREIAESSGSPSENAARMAVARAVMHLAERMDKGKAEP
jgi:RNA polymerase sigma-70 factor (ECF subfamily)